MLSSYAASSAVLNISGMESWRVDYANRFGFAGDGAWEDGVSWDNQPRIQAEGMLMNRALLTTGGKSKSPQGWHRAKTHDYRRAHTLQDLRTFAMFAQLPEYSNAIWEVARDIVKDVYGPGVVEATVELLDRDAGVARTGWLVAMMDGCFHTIPWHSPRFLCRLGLNSLRKRRGVWAVKPPLGSFDHCLGEWKEIRRAAGRDRDDVHKAVCVFHKVAGVFGFDKTQLDPKSCDRQGNRFWRQFAARHKTSTAKRQEL